VYFYINLISNLWPSRTSLSYLPYKYFRYTRLLNRVIIVLLRIHLAPKRERLKREKKVNNPQKAPLDPSKCLIKREPVAVQSSKKWYAHC
jgi:hypothetical protein